MDETVSKSKTKGRRGPYRKRRHSDDDLDLTISDTTVSELNDSKLSTEIIDIDAQTLHYGCSVSTENAQDKANMATSYAQDFTCTRDAYDPKGNTDVDVGRETKVDLNSIFDEEELISANLKNKDPELDEIFNELYENTLQDIDDETFVDSDAELTDDQQLSATLGDSDDPDSKPLYPGAAVTVGAFMLLLSLFCTKHNLIGDGILQLLNIMAFAIPKGHTLCTSLHSYKMFFQNLRNPIVKHYYCNHCLGYIVDPTLIKCPYSACGRELDKSNRSYFLEMPVDTQVKQLFSQENFFSRLQGRFKGNSKSGLHQDIYDGKLYKSYCENDGPLSKAENISFTFNTDGAPVFKSSKISVWPLFLVINELPYQIRMKKENMILAGLWFGNQKPSMGTFFKPFLDTFKLLSRGIKCFSPERGNFISKSYLLCGTADLPARCLLCNSVQFNGAFSCWKCLQKGETAKVGKGHTHVFPFIAEHPKGPERTQESVIGDSRAALDKQESGRSDFIVNGVKGPSWLAFFPRFNIVDGIAIDYMHGVLLGVQKLMLRLWFAPEFKGKNFSFHSKVCEVDRRLQNLQPTLEITRLPRSIETDLKYWKASEYRSFLLFFGAVVLHGILDSNRFSHYLLLVNSLHILLKFGSRESDISCAENMLLKFCGNFEQLYDKCYMTLNIHQLVHLADSVRNLGPLYAHSCFSFEDKNGLLLKMIRGTQNIDNQIITGVSFVQKLPELKQKFIINGSDEECLYNSIESPNLLKRREMIGNGTYVMGAIKMRTLSENEYAALCTFLGCAATADKLKSFNRIEIRGQLIYGLEYARMIKRDNSTVMYKAKNNLFFGRVRYFVQLDRNADDVAAVTEVLRCQKYDDECNILAVEKTNEIEFVSLKDIQESCMFVSYGGTVSFVAKFPNRVESE